jgi:polyhydroxyalkanoate synthase subunit PhaC
MAERNTSMTDRSKEFAEVAERSQKLIQDFLAKTAKEGPSFRPDGDANLDPSGIGKAFLELTQRMMANPSKMMEAQTQLWQSYIQLWAATTKRMLGEPAEPVASPAKGDRRFNDASWSENVVFDYIKQSYLLTGNWLMNNVQEAEYPDERTRQKVNFYMRQYVDAMAPTNFLATNPTVLKETVESGGENLLRGLKHLLEDLEAGQGSLKIRQTAPDTFEVGKNIAVSKGKVVFENRLMQLLHYEPSTEQQFERPLMIVPPWINKYYILDLQPKNSFIKWATDQGHSVYVLSWVNPYEELANASFEDYISEGVLAALKAVEEDTGVVEVNAVGYCLGGTLLASTLAVMAAKGDDRIKSATYFASLADFSEPGELGIFIDEEQIKMIEDMMAKKGYLDGNQMATTFNMLRSNDLIWSFVINNYLMGKDPFPFDLLYWNSDSTRMPKAMHSFYLRNMYQQNQLAQPGALTLLGAPIDLGAIKTPTMSIATKEDHIAPWKAVYNSARLFGGDTRLVLAASGHIAGIVNPPAANKYGYWLNPKLGTDRDEWLAKAKEHQGSWWPYWQEWITKYAGDKVPARVPGAGKLKAIEDAPGRYVKM